MNVSLINVLMLLLFLKKFRSRNNDLPTPPGFNPSVGQSHMEVTMDTDQSHLILKKSWDIALGPIKQVNKKPFDSPI